MTAPTASTYPDVNDGLTSLERITVRAVASAKGDEQTRCSRTVAGASRREPHFPSADIYATLTRLAQDWHTPYPLIDGVGDFGSAAGAPAAGSVTTKATISPIGASLIDELDLPDDHPGQRLHLRAAIQILPGPFPHLLANGSQAAGSTFLPHNIGELTAAIAARLSNADISLEAIRDILPGPDFATPTSITNASGLDEIYATGKGQLRVRYDGADEDERIDVDHTAYVDGAPKRLGLLELIDAYLEHRRGVLRRKHHTKALEDIEKIIAHDLSEIAERFARERRTQIVRSPA